MNEPEYILERYQYGWLLKGPGQCVPIDRLVEIQRIMPKDAVIHIGIATALKGIWAVGTKEDCAAWKKEIDDDLAAQSITPELKWIRGTDTGLSSISMFLALVNKHKNPQAYSQARLHYARTGHPGDAPSDASDFGRCQRLLDLFPEWEKPHMLNLVTMAYPGTAWIKIIPEWPRLKALHQREDTLELNRELRKLNIPPP